MKKYKWKEYSVSIRVRMTKKQLYKWIVYLQKELEYWKHKAMMQPLFDKGLKCAGGE